MSLALLRKQPDASAGAGHFAFSVVTFCAVDIRWCTGLIRGLRSCDALHHWGLVVIGGIGGGALVRVGRGQRGYHLKHRTVKHALTKGLSD